MNKKLLFQSAGAINALAELLMKCPEVSRYNEGEYNEAGTLAHSFSDLEKSFDKFSNDLLPKLVKSELETSEIYDLLLEIGEEFRHVLYHIQDPRFFKYLFDNGPSKDP